MSFGIAIDGELSPLQNYVLVRIDEVPTTTAAGLTLPDSMVQEVPVTGTVVKAGPGLFNEYHEPINMLLAVGDRVLLSKYAGTEVEVADAKHLIVRDTDALALIE